MKNLIQYIFIFLIIIMLLLIYVILKQKYTDYRVYKYTQQVSYINTELSSKISLAKEILENRNTKAYKNKVLKSEQGMKNKGEEVIFLITEEKYNTYTQDKGKDEKTVFLPQNLLDEESLLSTMSIYQKWVYFIF